MLWGAVQHSRGRGFDFSAYDGSVAAAARQGIEVLPTLFGTPTFESGCSGVFCQRHIITSPQALNDWQAFVLAAAQRYGTNGSFWQQFPSIPYHPVTELPVLERAEQHEPEEQPARPTPSS